MAMIDIPTLDGGESFKAWLAEPSGTGQNKGQP